MKIVFGSETYTHTFKIVGFLFFLSLREKCWFDRCTIQKERLSNRKVVMLQIFFFLTYLFRIRIELTPTFLTFRVPYWKIIILIFVLCLFSFICLLTWQFLRDIQIQIFLREFFTKKSFSFFVFYTHFIFLICNFINFYFLRFFLHNKDRDFCVIYWWAKINHLFICLLVNHFGLHV